VEPAGDNIIGEAGAGTLPLVAIAGPPRHLQEGRLPIQLVPLRDVEVTLSVEARVAQLKGRIMLTGDHERARKS
jgi:hypothetical protein